MMASMSSSMAAMSSMRGAMMAGGVFPGWAGRQWLSGKGADKRNVDSKKSERRGENEGGPGIQRPDPVRSLLQRRPGDRLRSSPVLQSSTGRGGGRTPVPGEIAAGTVQRPPQGRAAGRRSAAASGVAATRPRLPARPPVSSRSRSTRTRASRGEVHDLADRGVEPPPRQSNGEAAKPAPPPAKTSDSKSNDSKTATPKS